MTITINILEDWDEKIKKFVDQYGLTCYPQEFEICDHEEMLAYMAYSGMPSHYSHWSYGKSFEKQKTLYDLGVSGLPYEMVINSNPCLAYLMRDNSLCLQILTIAHVYGHNDFFANNFYFKTSLDAKYTLEMFKSHARRVDTYLQDPSIGVDQVEAILDNAHALSLQRSKNFIIQKGPLPTNQPNPNAEYFDLKNQESPNVTTSSSLEDEDILLFIAEYGTYLDEWQRDLLMIVDAESKYFIPQIETKIMNEGWASYWHYTLMNALQLSQSLHLEFLVNHSQVIRPHEGNLNPYHLGFVIWNDLEARWNMQEANLSMEEVARMSIAEQNQTPGRKKIFEVRETDRDISFLRRFLTEDIMRSMDIFQHEQKGDERIITKVSDQQHWHDVKQTLIHHTGTNSLPVIKILDADFGRKKTLYLKHYHDGRDLKLADAEKSLRSVANLWGREVVLETSINDELKLLSVDEGDFKIKSNF